MINTGDVACPLDMARANPMQIAGAMFSNWKKKDMQTRYNRNALKAMSRRHSLDGGLKEGQPLPVNEAQKGGEEVNAEEVLQEAK